MSVLCGTELEIAVPEFELFGFVVDDSGLGWAIRCLIALNGLVSLLVLFSRQYRLLQKVLQVLLIWSVPVSALPVFLMLRHDTRRPVWNDGGSPGKGPEGTYD